MQNLITLLSPYYFFQFVVFSGDQRFLKHNKSNQIC